MLKDCCSVPSYSSFRVLRAGVERVEWVAELYSSRSQKGFSNCDVRRRNLKCLQHIDPND